MKNTRIRITDIGLLGLSLLFFVGMNTFAAPCGPKADGGWMTCHWAGMAVNAIAGVLVIISLLHLVIPDFRIRLGLSLAAIPLAACACFIPGSIIGLCMMKDMRCHTVMAPAVSVFAFLIIIMASADIFVWAKEKRHEF